LRPADSNVGRHKVLTEARSRYFIAGQKIRSVYSFEKASPGLLIFCSMGALGVEFNP
jgi:hypothetical protein